MKTPELLTRHRSSQLKKDSSIRLQYVKDYLCKRDDTQVKPKPKAYNRFVPPGANFEFAVDTMDM